MVKIARHAASANWLSLFLLAALGLACFWSALRVPPETEGLAFLDHPLLLGAYDSFGHWLLEDFAAKMHFIRPVPLALQGFIVTTIPNHTVILRLINLSALIGAGFLIYLLLVRSGLKSLPAWLGGAFWVIHPINVINVIKIIHLGYLLGSFFCLLALYHYARYRDQNKSPQAFFCEGLIVLLMLFSYELFVVAPLLLALYEFFIQAQARFKDVRKRNLVASLALWGGLVFGYLVIRFFVFRGVGGYENFWENNPLSPLLKGGKWLSGWGFLHILGQPLGLGDLATAAVLAALAGRLFLRKENRYLIVFAALWFMAASLPYFFITATYHYVFAFASIGCAIALAMALDQMSNDSRSGVARIASWIAVGAFLLLLAFERSAAIASVAQRIEDDSIPAGLVADNISLANSSVTVFLASERPDSHLQLRVDLLLRPARIHLVDLTLPLQGDEINAAQAEDSALTESKAYLFRQGRRIDVYPDLASLISACQRGKSSNDDQPRRRKP